MKRIYLDYAATSPVKPEVFEAMKPYLAENFGNPSSIHWFGRQARAAIDKARQIVAEFLNCSPEEIIFTSGGTESDNLAIRGLIASFQNSKFEILNPKQIPNSNNSNSKSLKNLDLGNLKIVSDLEFKVSNLKPNVITSAFEHHAVLHTCQGLEKQGLAEVTYIKPDKEGIIDIEDVKKAIKPNTVLISIMYVNNEIGTVQPIQKIVRVLSKSKSSYHNSKLKGEARPLTQIYFHTDAVQAVEYQEMDVQKLGVDMLSLSAHKFGGPKGVGVLYVKKGTPLSAIQTGGEQEWRKRAGTENVAGIIGMAKAIQLLNSKPQTLNSKQIQNLNIKNSKNLQNLDLGNLKIVLDLELRVSSLTQLRDYFIDQIMGKIPDVSLNGSREKRNPNNINLSFKYVEGEAVLLNLDLAGIAASSGSACTSGSLDPSHVLLSIGLKHEDAHGSIRFTLGEKTTKEEIDYTVKELVKIVRKLRKMSPFGGKN